jgi:hypothetical protein
MKFSASALSQGLPRLPMEPRKQIHPTPYHTGLPDTGRCDPSGWIHPGGCRRASTAPWSRRAARAVGRTCQLHRWTSLRDGETCRTLRIEIGGDYCRRWTGVPSATTFFNRSTSICQLADLALQLGESLFSYSAMSILSSSCCNSLRAYVANRYGDMCFELRERSHQRNQQELPTHLIVASSCHIAIARLTQQVCPASPYVNFYFQFLVAFFIGDRYLRKHNGARKQPLWPKLIWSVFVLFAQRRSSPASHRSKCHRLGNWSPAPLF